MVEGPGSLYCVAKGHCNGLNKEPDAIHTATRTRTALEGRRTGGYSQQRSRTGVWTVEKAVVKQLRAVTKRNVD